MLQWYSLGGKKGLFCTGLKLSQNVIPQIVFDVKKTQGVDILEIKTVVWNIQGDTVR